jgi:hypothetical protein
VASESTRTAAFLKAWRLKYPDGGAWKINDRIARSRPDAVFFRQGRTTLVEFKLFGNDVTPGQAYELHALARTHHRVFVVWFGPHGTITSHQYGPLGQTWTYGPISAADFLDILA